MTITRRHALLLGAALSVSLLATACGSSGDGGSGAAATQGASTDDLQAALDAGGSITVWAWEPTLKKVVADFQTKYPKVKVNLVNAGTGNDQYTALQNAVKAGSGVPDVAQIEYYALPQFALGKAVADLTAFGADKLDGTFTPGPWGAVHSGSGIYGLPMDSGPMALFYNKDVFDKHKIDVPATWDEYIAAAKKLHDADPKAYITNDTGDAGFTTSMIWQAGGKPYQVDGTKVSVNFADAGTQKFTTAWQQLVSGKLVAPVSSWSDAWYKGLGDGSIATLVIGAWMPANLETGVKAGAGKWRVAPMPQWESGGKATSENGGSSLAVPEAAANKKLAYAFAKYASVDEGAQARVDGGAFPATKAQLESPAFRDKKFAYFGDQQINQVLAESASQVVPGWSYLPYQVYANSVFNDTVGKAYISGTTLQDGLKAWQDASVKYGQEQGFTVQ
ncbi:sugar ABC transporter substrate-binding protein [Nonomuraea sp. 3-1Str]|uniref:ABC transporter substrate-binding protein n=1 Tax=Nonomuraea sp. 3-1Str TaxID=2929801 RepID=UPI002867228F|nr:sugar ABC transporter substrate-binding protein [Nonomuraea sp. 3-1Str]MDR8414449.1 sugar ABC transporter substrate-binding protein [Nonomuraea sp. 3-1Str]